MINIIILHINNGSKLLTINYNFPKFKSVWFLEIMSFWGVDGFGIISGLFGYKQYKFSNLIYIWILTLFYSTFLSFYMFFINNNEKTKKTLILSFFPLLIKRHWYVNAYFCMYIFLPFINYGINNLRQKTLRNLILFFIFFFSIYNIIGAIILGRINYPFLNDGYSPIWLSILYILGAYLKKYTLKNNISFFYYILWILIYLLSSFFSYEIFFILLKNEIKIIPNKIFMNYLSPTIILQSISLIFIFSRLSIKNLLIKKIISFFAPLTFSTTLIHIRLFNDNFKYTRKFLKWISEFKPNYTFFKIYGIAIIIYIICSFIDYLRFLLFKIIKIKELCKFIESKFPVIIDKIIFSIINSRKNFQVN